jgi:hypothetical protein
MPITEPLRKTLAAAGAVLEDAFDPWWIVTGAAAAIHGAALIHVSDVDVMLSVRDASRLFSRLGVIQAPPSNHPRFRSEIFGQWDENPLIVEFMANFKLRDLDGAWRPMVPTTRMCVEVAGVKVYIPELADLRGMFERFGREKDLERINLLDHFR